MIRTTTYGASRRNTFGGIISQEDFCTDYPRNKKRMSIAERIVSDWKFDEDCKKNYENTMRNNKGVQNNA